MKITINIESAFEQPLAAAEFLVALQALNLKFAALFASASPLALAATSGGGAASAHAAPLNSGSPPLAPDSDGATHLVSLHKPLSAVAPLSSFRGASCAESLKTADSKSIYADENRSSQPDAATEHGLASHPSVAAATTDPGKADEAVNAPAMLEKTKRTRRTKEQIAADDAREVELRAHSNAPVASAPVPETVASAKPEAPAVAAVVSTNAAPYSMRDLQDKFLAMAGPLKNDRVPVSARITKVLNALGVPKLSELTNKQDQIPFAIQLLDMHFQPSPAA